MPSPLALSLCFSQIERRLVFARNLFSLRLVSGSVANIPCAHESVRCDHKWNTCRSNAHTRTLACQCFPFHTCGIIFLSLAGYFSLDHLCLLRKGGGMVKIDHLSIWELRKQNKLTSTHTCPRSHKYEQRSVNFEFVKYRTRKYQ